MKPATTAPIVTTLGGPTTMLEIGGLRFLTDPTFDDPGEYPTGAGYSLIKLAGPAIPATSLPPIDVVLLSHDQHPDNLDEGGRALLPTVATVLTTQAAAERLGAPNVVGLAPWEAVQVQSEQGSVLTVTALPAQHGPDDSHHLLGPVIGFRLDAEGLPSVYFSGDNASLAVVTEIRERTGPLDIAILCAGAARTPRLGDALLTLNGDRSAEAARILGARSVIVVHSDGWQHFSEGPEDVRAAFAGSASTLISHQHGVPHLV